MINKILINKSSPSYLQAYNNPGEPQGPLQRLGQAFVKSLRANNQPGGNFGAGPLNNGPQGPLQQFGQAVAQGFNNALNPNSQYGSGWLYNSPGPSNPNNQYGYNNRPINSVGPGNFNRPYGPANYIGPDNPSNQYGYNGPINPVGTGSNPNGQYGLGGTTGSFGSGNSARPGAPIGSLDEFIRRKLLFLIMSFTGMMNNTFMNNKVNKCCILQWHHFASSILCILLSN